MYRRRSEAVHDFDLTQSSPWHRQWPWAPRSRRSADTSLRSVSGAGV